MADVDRTLNLSESHHDEGHIEHEHPVFFHSDVKLTVLLEVFRVDSILGVTFVGVIFVVLSMCYEGVRCLRMHLAEKHQRGRKKITIRSMPHLIQTALFLPDILLSYVIMLMVMTFNVWMLVAVVIGSTIGYQLCKLLTGPHIIRISQPPAPAPAPIPDSAAANNVANESGGSDGQKNGGNQVVNGKAESADRAEVEEMEALVSSI